MGGGFNFGSFDAVNIYLDILSIPALQEAGSSDQRAIL
jgi:hypothetical protein